jgi:hypothetical protein
MPRPRMTPLYDTYVLAANTALPTTIQLFGSRTAAADGINKTNLKRVSQLDDNERFYLQALRFVPIGMDEEDIVNLMKNYAARLKVGNTIELEAPIEFWAGGAGLAGVAAASTTATTTTINIRQFSNGVPDPRAVFGMGDYVIELGGATFSVELVGTTFTSITTGTGIFLRCYLDGVFQKDL